MPSPHTRGYLAAAALLLAGALMAPPAAAQETLDRPLRVYLDCQGFHCDSDYFVEEVPWVDFVRDRQDADVHVLGTRERTGGGGGSYTLEFRGRDALDDQLIRLGTTTESDATEDDTRSALAGLVRQGLAPFAAATPSAPLVEVRPPAVEEGEELTPEEDPWDRWNFRVGVNGFMNGESQQRFLNSSGNISASRVTDAWKIQMQLGGSLSEQEFEAGPVTQSFTRRSYDGAALVVKSAGPHWGVGGGLSWQRSTFANYDQSWFLAPGVEYNVFPYSESNRRLLTILYGIGPRYNVYRDTTLFLEVEEWLIEQQLIVSYDVTQPWGSVDLSLTTNHYIAKFGEGLEWPEPQYNTELFGGFNIRLIRGLSLNLHGRVEMVRGQIQLAKGELTEEEILTRQRELATAYRYFFGFGLSYRFGSIFTSVVNPRFDDVFF